MSHFRIQPSLRTPQNTPHPLTIFSNVRTSPPILKLANPGGGGVKSINKTLSLTAYTRASKTSANHDFDFGRTSDSGSNATAQAAPHPRRPNAAEHQRHRSTVPPFPPHRRTTKKADFSLLPSSFRSTTTTAPLSPLVPIPQATSLPLILRSAS